MKFVQILQSKTDLVKGFIVATMGAIALYISTVEKWLNPEGDNSTALVVRFTLSTLKFELIFLLILCGFFILPRKRRAQILSRIVRMMRGLRYLVRQIIKKGFRLQYVAKFLIPAALIIAGILVVSANYNNGIVIAKFKLRLILNIDRDFLRYLCHEAEKRLLMGDLIGAEKTYNTILKFYGSRASTAKIREQIEKMRQFDIYSVVWTKRAFEMESELGRNPKSLFMLAEALRFSPRVGEVTNRIMAYDTTISTVKFLNSKLEKTCSATEPNPEELLRLTDVEMLGIRSFFANSVVAGVYGQSVNSTERATGIASTKSLCSYVSAYGKVALDYSEEWAEIRVLLAAVSKGKGIFSDE
jgi:hypothetical protein